MSKNLFHFVKVNKPKIDFFFNPSITVWSGFHKLSYKSEQYIKFLFVFSMYIREFAPFHFLRQTRQVRFENTRLVLELQIAAIERISTF